MAKPDWITLDKSSGSGGSSVKVTAAPNFSYEYPEGYLTIKTASGLTKDVSIFQNSATGFNFLVGGSSAFLEAMEVFFVKYN